MEEKTNKSWEGLLNPDALRRNLITASIYIAAFELLKDSIVDRLKTFYKLTGEQVEQRYEPEVLSRNRSPVYASLGWLKEFKAIDDDDITVFEKARSYRRIFAHELTRVLWDGLPPDVATRFSEMVKLMDKIERWWIVTLEDVQEGDEHAILPGRIFLLQLMVDVALGSEEDSKKFLNEFMKHTRPKKQSVN